MYEVKGMETLLKIRNKLEKALQNPVAYDKDQIKGVAFLRSRNQASKASTAPKEGLTSPTNLRCGDSEYARSFYRVKEGAREKNR